MKKLAGTSAGWAMVLVSQTGKVVAATASQRQATGFVPRACQSHSHRTGWSEVTPETEMPGTRCKAAVSQLKLLVGFGGCESKARAQKTSSCHHEKHSDEHHVGSRGRSDRASTWGLGCACSFQLGTATARRYEAGPGVQLYFIRGRPRPEAARPSCPNSYPAILPDR